MKNIHLILTTLVLFLSTHCLLSQCPTNLLLDTQDAIDNFSFNYPGCTTISGNLSIKNSNIINLDGLTQIEKIEGNLTIENTNIINTNGFVNLDSIGVNLNVLNNDLLETVSGFDNLISCKFFININANDVLSNINGFNALSNYNGHVVIQDNDNLNSITGFNAMQELTRIRIRDNISLDTIDAFDGVQSITRNLELEHNISLEYIGGFSNLTNIIKVFSLRDSPVLNSILSFNVLSNVGPIRIRDMDSLSDLNFLSAATNSSSVALNNLPNVSSLASLSALSSNMGFFQIKNCDSLTNLTGLENIVRISNLWIQNNDLLNSIEAFEDLSFINNVLIENNPLLSACNIQPICDLIESSGGANATFTNNAPDCNSEIEVTVECGLTSCPVNLTLQTQSEVDAFTTIYPECNMISGDLIINGTDITNVDSLYQIEKVGSIQILNTGLLNLNGLSQLDSVGIVLSVGLNNMLEDISAISDINYAKRIFIKSNPSLLNISGFNNLINFNGRVEIIDNSTILHLVGFNSVSSADEIIIDGNILLDSINIFNNLLTVSNDLKIDFNDNLEHLIGFSQLTTVGDEFSIKNVPLLQNQNILAFNQLGEVYRLVLRNLDGIQDFGFLSQLTECNIINIYSCSNLTTLEDLSALSSDINVFRIWDCHSLFDLDGLENIQSISTLTIENNHQLSSIQALSSTDLESTVQIYDNPSLYSCEIASLCNKIANEICCNFIYNNAFGCNSESEIQMRCNGQTPCLNTITLTGNIPSGIFSAQNEIIIEGIVPANTILGLEAAEINFEVESEVKLGAVIATNSTGCN